MQLNYYVLGQRIQKIRKNKRISQVSTDTLLNRQLTGATEMSNAEAQKIFANCTPYETYVLLDVLKTTKNALRSHHHLLKEEW